MKSWADIARAVFEAANGNGDRVVPVSTADYYAGAEGPVAPRPVHSALDLAKLESVGFRMPDWEDELGGGGTSQSFNINCSGGRRWHD